MVRIRLERVTRSTTLGGALVAVAGALWLLVIAGVGRDGVVATLATVALALGAVVLAAGRGVGSVVGASRAGRIALVVLGVGPVLLLLLPAPTPWSVLIGTSLGVLMAVAGVVVAVAVVRRPGLHGVARWAPVVLAADAVLNAVMSSVAGEGLAVAFLAGHLELLRPLTLLAWGVALGLRGRGPAIRGRIRDARDDWRRTTDVGGTGEPAPAVRR